MKPLRIAIFGAGYIAHYHARAIQALPGVTISSIISGSQYSAKTFAKQYGVPHFNTSIESLFEESKTDAVVIATPNKFHAPIAISSMEHGMDVLIEKPVAMSTVEGLQIQHVGAQTNRIVMVGHMWRSDVETIYLREQIAKEVLGSIIKTKGYGIHKDWGPEGWFVQKDLSGGGALIDMGVHAIDTVRFLLGDPKAISVYAKIGTYYGKYDVDDSNIIVINWETGTTSIIESGWWHPHMDGPEAATRLFGTKGYGSLFPTKIELSNEEEYSIPTFPTKEEHCDQSIYDRQMKKFISSIQSRSQPDPGIEEGLYIIKIVDAAYRSSETGKVVSL